MPIQVQISVNHDLKRTLHIGRNEHFLGKDYSHSYTVTGEVFPQTIYPGKLVTPQPDWRKGFLFDHVYSDGLLACVRLGIAEFEKHYVS